MNGPKGKIAFLVLLQFFGAAQALSSEMDPVCRALEQFKELHSYSVTLKIFGKKNREIIQYSFKKPGFVRMDFLKPHRGAVLLYNPESRKAKLFPFGQVKLFRFSLNPENPLIRSPNGHRVDESDVGTLLKTVEDLQKSGKTRVLREEIVDEKKSLVVQVQGNSGHCVRGNVNRYILWLDQEIFLPVKVEAYDLEGLLIEGVLLENLRINVSFGEIFFY